jgi:C1A family cysteine protease
LLRRERFAKLYLVILWLFCRDSIFWGVFERGAMVNRTGTMILLLCLFAFTGTTWAQSSTSSTGLYWQQLDPKADMDAFRASVENAGGKVVNLTPEYRALVQLPTSVATTARFAGTSSAPSATSVKEKTTSTPANQSRRALGALRRSTSEQLNVLRNQSVNPVTEVQPSTLALARAAVQKKSTTTASSADSTKATVSASTLPTSVDNSTSIYFPPIGDQGWQGSCTAWAAGYYYNTYLQAKDEATTASTGNTSVICSPTFLYDLTNDGVDYGAYTSDVMTQLNKSGCCSLAEMAYDSDRYFDCTIWPSSDAWVEALPRRTLSTSYVYMNSNTNINKVKQLLANGELVVTETDCYYNWWADYGETATGIDNWVLYSTANSEYEGGHALAIVGYDDTRAYSVNGTTKYGAFLVANSWGSSWGATNTNGDTGYMWVAYDYIKSTGNFAIAYHNVDREKYRPLVYALTAIDCTNRSAITYSGGLGSNPASPTWSGPSPIARSGGSVAVTNAEPIAVDLTDALDYTTAPDPKNFFVKVSNASGSGVTATLADATLYYDFDDTGTYDSITSVDSDVSVAAGAKEYAQFPVVAVTSFALNGGNNATDNPVVALTHYCYGTPVSYKASQYSDFRDVVNWLPYSSDLTLTLSTTTIGTKKVYFKVQTADGDVSDVVSDTIAFYLPVVTSLKINGGSATATSQTVTLDNFYSSVSIPSQYLASESSTFTGAEWKSYSATPTFTLSTGVGTKRIYFKVQNAYGQVSNTKVDTISLAAPRVTSFKINKGAASTGDPVVTLNNSCSGSPTAYMISTSSDFDGASWVTGYSNALSFTLPASTDGTKTVYFKVKNALGVESLPVNDSIELNKVVLDSFSLASAYDDNVTTTTGRSVKLVHAYTSNSAPEYYMVSQSSKFSGANWIPYTAGSTITYSLTGVSGTKTVYFKLKRNGQVSNIKPSTIILSLPVISSFKLDGGNLTTTDGTVTLDNQVTGGETIATYVASESSSFAASSATTKTGSYGLAPAFTLSTTAGTKRVYFKVINAAGEVSAVKSATIKNVITIGKSAKSAATSTVTASATAKTTTALTATKTTTNSTGTSASGTSPSTTVVTTGTQGTALPDLQAVDYTLSSAETTAGTLYTATLTISNESATAAGKFHVALYLLTDDTWNLDNLYLVKEVTVDGLAAGDETTAVWNFTMPVLDDNMYVVCPVFAIDSQQEITPFDLSKVVRFDSLITVAP